MTIGSIGAYSANRPDQLLLSLLSRLTNTQPISSSTTTATSATQTVTPAASNDNALTGSGKAQLSEQILSLLTMMQAVQPATQDTTTTTSSETQDPLKNLIANVDTDGDGSISQSEMEGYIQGLGGTQAQADSLFTTLNQNASGNLTEAQLSSDLQKANASHHAHGHHHHHGASADHVASQLMQAMDSSGDSSVDQTEFENFVTSIGGTTDEADSDFAALSSNGGITADQFTSAIKSFEQSSQTPSKGSNAILTLLDNLGTQKTGATTSV